MTHKYPVGRHNNLYKPLKQCPLIRVETSPQFVSYDEDIGNQEEVSPKGNFAMTFNFNLNARSNKLPLMNTTLLDSYIRTPSATLKQAIAKDSNLARDWLWVAEQVTTENERAYCLQKALFIDPKSDVARQKLAEMHRLSTSKTQRSNAMLLNPVRLLQNLVR